MKKDISNVAVNKSVEKNNKEKQIIIGNNAPGKGRYKHYDYEGFKILVPDRYCCICASKKCDECNIVKGRW